MPHNVDRVAVTVRVNREVSNQAIGRMPATVSLDDKDPRRFSPTSDVPLFYLTRRH